MDLPVEMWENILTSLPSLDLWPARGVSRTFALLVWRLMGDRPVTVFSEEVWGHLSSCGWKDITLSLSEMPAICPEVKKLVLRDCRIKRGFHLAATVSVLELISCQLGNSIWAKGQDCLLRIRGREELHLRLWRFNKLTLCREDLTEYQGSFHEIRKCREVCVEGHLEQYLFRDVDNLTCLVGMMDLRDEVRLKKFHCGTFPNRLDLKITHLICPFLNASNWEVLDAQCLEIVETSSESLQQVSRVFPRVHTMIVIGYFSIESVSHFFPALRNLSRK